MYYNRCGVNRVCNKSSTADTTSGTGTAYPSGAHEFTPCFSGVRAAQSLVFCVMFCVSLFVPFLLAIGLSAFLQFTASDYPFGIFKHFSEKNKFQGKLVKQTISLKV